MNNDLTFTIIKPCAFESGYTGAILNDIIAGGFKIIAMKLTRMTPLQAGQFYSIHKEKPFFGELIDYMTSGPIVVALLQKENAVRDFRTLIGATNPEEAAEGTIRKKYARSLSSNAIHGSDSDENAAIESGYFFSTFDLI